MSLWDANFSVSWVDAVNTKTRTILIGFTVDFCHEKVKVFEQQNVTIC